MPETYWVFQKLGVLDKMRGEGFVPKVGVQFVNQSGRESQPFFFDAHDPRDCSTTWHVERDRFDHLLFVLALILIVPGWWMLLKTITAPALVIH